MTRVVAREVDALLEAVEHRDEVGPLGRGRFRHAQRFAAIRWSARRPFRWHRHAQHRRVCG